MYKPGPQESTGIDRHATSKSKNELKSFLGILTYMSQFSTVTAEVCEALWKLTSVKYNVPKSVQQG